MVSPQNLQSVAWVVASGGCRRPCSVATGGVCRCWFHPAWSEANVKPQLGHQHPNSLHKIRTATLHGQQRVSRKQVIGSKQSQHLHA
jgi:hypothetical protein